jgi:hypothetical protein
VAGVAIHGMTDRIGKGRRAIGLLHLKVLRAGRGTFLVPLALLLLAAQPVKGAELNITWGLGDVETYFSSAAATIDGHLSLGRLNLWIDKRFCLGCRLFDVGGISDDRTISYAFLPLQAEFFPVNLWDAFYIGLYGKAAWRFTQDRKDFNPFARAPDNGFSGGGGLEFLLPLLLPFHYDAGIALFVEYGVPEGFKAGFRMDLLSLAALYTLTDL